jgi:hypothetical protein
MNCRECRPLLSELIDEELAPVRESQVRKHCDECPACGSELRQLALTVEAFKAAPRDEPPARLAGQILEALPAAIEGRASRPVELPGKWRFLPWGSAAAALLLAGLAFLWAEQARRDYASKAAELDDRLHRELARQVERSSKEKASFATELATTRKSVEEVREASRAASIQRDKEKEGWRIELESLDARLALQADRVRELERSLALAREETSSVRDELAAAIRAAPGAGSPETIEQGSGRKETKPAAVEPASSGGEHLASAEAGASDEGEPQGARKASIRFRRQGEFLQLEMTGPRKDLVPELFRIAGDGTDDTQAGLALNALESLLGGREPTRGPEPESRETPAGLWSRGVGFLADEMGLGGSTEDAPSAPGTDRASRLRRLQERWRDARLGPQAARR